MKKTVWFEIGYKGFLGQESEWFTERVRAINHSDALELFAKHHRIKGEAPKWETWRWEDNDWLMGMRYCKEVKKVRCPACRAVDWEDVESIWPPSTRKSATG